MSRGLSYLRLSSLLLGLNNHYLVAQDLPPVIDIYHTCQKATEVEALQTEITALKKQLQEANHTIYAQTHFDQLQQTKQPFKQRLRQYLPFVFPKNSLADQLPALANNSWQEACQLMEQKQYKQSIQAFQQFVKHYPQHSNQPKAHCLLGQLELLIGNPKQSLYYAKLFLKQYPDDVQAPTMQFQLGLAYFAQKNKAMAYKAFNRVIECYPEHALAKKAQNYLVKLDIGTFSAL